MQTSRERLVDSTMFAVVTLGLAAFPLLGMSGRMTNLAALAAMWATAVFGLYLSYAVAGQLTAAAPTVWAVSVFSVALSANEWGPPLPVLFAIGVVSGLVAGAVLALPILRTSGHYFVVVSFALVQLGVIFGRNWNAIDNNTAGVFVIYQPTLGPWHLERTADALWLACGCLTLAFITVSLISSSRFGRRWLAVRENEHLAATVGCPVRFYKMLSLTIGGGVTGMAGVLPVVIANHVQIENYSFSAAITFFIVLIVGGRRSVVGPIAGAIFWFLGPELLGVEPVVGEALFGAVLVLTILLMPAGVFVGARDAIALVLRKAFGVRRQRGEQDAMSTPAEPADLEGGQDRPTVEVRR